MSDSPWNDLGWGAQVNAVHGVDLDGVAWPDGGAPHVIQTDYRTSVRFTADLVPDLDGLWEQVSRLASRQAADELLIKEMATLLEDNPDRTSGYLIYREHPDGGWQIVHSPFIPRNQVYLCRVGLPDLGVKREPDGKYQGYRQKQADPLD